MNRKQFILNTCLGVLLSMATLPVSAQNRVVKGQVVDEIGEPVMGATVVVEGTTGNGGSLNSQNDKFDTMNLGNVILNQDLSISIDADLSEKWADSFVGTSVSGSDSESIVISNINILAGSSDKMPVSLTVTNDNLKENVKLDNKTVKEDKKPEDSVIILGDASTKNGTNKQAEVEKISEPIIPKNELNK